MRKPFPPPLASPYGTFTGQLFQYRSPFPSLVAFESSPPSPLPSDDDDDDDCSSSWQCPNKCILLGGLSDGLLPVPYTQSLLAQCHESNWSLVQPLLSSSYLGFGSGTLERDTSELCELMNYLGTHRNGKRFALVGHSTGCQNGIHFLKYAEEEWVERMKLIVLQAPVSDREHAMTEPNYEENITLARAMVDEGKEMEMMPRSAFWAPITSRRFLDLQDLRPPDGKGGADDYFSSDLTDGQMLERLGHVGEIGFRRRGRGRGGLKVLAAFSGKDEYVPDHVDKGELLRRMCHAMNNHRDGGAGDDGDAGDVGDDPPVAIPLMLDTANHNLSMGEQELFVEEVGKLLRECGAERS